MSEGDNILEKLWENEEVLNKMKELVAEASKREAVCECDYNMASEDWFEYIEKEYRVNLTDYELEMLNEKFTEEMYTSSKKIRDNQAIVD